MIDRSSGILAPSLLASGNFGQLLRSPDLRLGDIRTEIVRGPLPFTHRVKLPDRGVFVYVLEGDVWLDVAGTDLAPMLVKQGSAVGFENGRAHQWTAAAEKPGDTHVALFISSIPRTMGVLQQIEHGLIIVPPDAAPFAGLFAHSVAIHLAEHALPPAMQDETIIRRAAEICMIQFVRYARMRLLAAPDVPAALSHDEYLLRAWTAYFSDPQQRWTVAALAKAAGLGRSAFSDRFTRVFGAPPLQTLTRLKLQQAEAMLKHGHAPLIAIAFSVGYNSEAAFVRAFHRQYGIPPGKYRNAVPSLTSNCVGKTRNKHP